MPSQREVTHQQGESPSLNVAGISRDKTVLGSEKFTSQR